MLLNAPAELDNPPGVISRASHVIRSAAIFFNDWLATKGVTFTAPDKRTRPVVAQTAIDERREEYALTERGLANAVRLIIIVLLCVESSGSGELENDVWVMSATAENDFDDWYPYHTRYGLGQPR